MAAKRLLDEDQQNQNQKRMKTRPSFASVIREVVMVNFFDNFCSTLEPVLRRVVSEEVENGLRQRCMNPNMLRCSPLRTIQQASDNRPTSSLQLAFATGLALPIFTSIKIVDANNNPLQIILNSTSLLQAIKLEIVVLDGDFPTGDAWTSDEFMKNIVKERAGKRPLLTGNLNITMKDGFASVGDIEFTDNSSWIRSRKFRLGARVLQNGEGGVMISEAISEAFVVKDHRGELYKKHHPPALEDEVWRLEKIGKGGSFHRKLASHRINTVQDFLKLFNVDSPKLRKILGIGMSERMWEATVKHAKTCVMGYKLYKYRGNEYTLTLNPICQLIKADFNGHAYYERDLKRPHTPYIQSLVKDAYERWSSLEEVEGPVHETSLLTQGEMVGSYVPDTNGSLTQDNEVQGEYLADWALNSGPSFYLTANSAPKSGPSFFSESSSECDIA